MSRFAVAGVVVGLSAPGLCAPELPPLPSRQNSEQELPAIQTQTRLFQLRNVQPSLVAFWLDPSRKTAPLAIQADGPLSSSEKQLRALPRLPGNGNGPSDLKLPPGVQSLVPIDPQNGLLARGTPGGLDALEKLLSSLDVPLNQVEVEATFWQVEREALAATGLKFPPALNDGRVYASAALASPETNANLTGLQTKKRARVLVAPRVVAIDGVRAELLQTVSVPFKFDPNAPDEKDDALNAAGDVPLGTALLTTSTGFSVTPLLRSNDKITLSLSPQVGAALTSVLATLRDGQTLALLLSAPDAEQKIVVLVTPRIVRRVPLLRDIPIL